MHPDGSAYSETAPVKAPKLLLSSRPHLPLLSQTGLYGIPALPGKAGPEPDSAGGGSEQKGAEGTPSLLWSALPPAARLYIVCHSVLLPYCLVHLIPLSLLFPLSFFSPH